MVCAPLNRRETNSYEGTNEEDAEYDDKHYYTGLQLRRHFDEVPNSADNSFYSG